MAVRHQLNVFILFVSVWASTANAQTPSKPSDVKTQAVSYSATLPSDDKYRIGFQDTLEIQVFRHPELAQKVTVNSNGTINLFRLDQSIVAVCKTERELGDAIVEAYKKYYLKNPEVNVVAVEQRSQAFAVIGRWKSPAVILLIERSASRSSRSSRRAL